MRSVKKIFVIGIIATAPLSMSASPAFADVITTFSLSNAATENDFPVDAIITPSLSVSGTFMIDQTTYSRGNGDGFAGGSLSVAGSHLLGVNGNYNFREFVDAFALFQNSSVDDIFVYVGVPPMTNGSSGLLGDGSYFTYIYEPTAPDNFISGSIRASTPSPSSVPEPSSVASLVIGLASLGLIRRRLQKAA